MILLAAGVFLAIAASTFWLDRVAFSPSPDTDATQAILADEDIRSEVSGLIAGATAPTLGQSPAQLKEFIEQIAAIPAGATLMTDFVSEAHAVVIGEQGEPVEISGPEQVLIVRDERVALMSPITLPVPEIQAVAVYNTINGWLMLIGLVLGVLAVIVGLVTRPERGEITLAAGVGLASLGVLFIVFGYLVPVALLPAMSDTSWAGLFPALANESRTITLVLALVALIAAGLIVVGTSSIRQRRQWSTPLAVGRYREERSWSR